MFLIGLFLFSFSFHLRALVPVEGPVLGRANQVFQRDPLQHIFSHLDQAHEGPHKNKIKYYISSLKSSQYLEESCAHLEEPRYPTAWEEHQAHRSVVATLQLIGLDTSIKAVGAYANKFKMSLDDFQKLSANLVNSYCSQNVSVLSLKTIRKSLDYYFENPQMTILPTVAESPFVSEMIKDASESSEARSKEFDYVLKNFRAFCSWGGQISDYRMLGPYLKNSMIMSFVFKNLQGLKDQIQTTTQAVQASPDSSTVQVSCEELICRKKSLHEFRKKFPLTAGSTGLATDLNKMYCHHFRFQDYAPSKVPQIQSWQKVMELEEPVLEISQFISLMTGVPNFLNSKNEFNEIPGLIKSTIDEKWKSWAQASLLTYATSLPYEEYLRVEVSPSSFDPLAFESFGAHFNLILGEMDRVLIDNDKLTTWFEITLSKNYLRSIKTRWVYLEKNLMAQEKKKFRDEISHYLDLQIKQKKKLFKQKIWTPEFSKLVTDVLIQQLQDYRGSLFESFAEEMIKVPIRFSYGLFALMYLHEHHQLLATPVVHKAVRGF